MTSVLLLLDEIPTFGALDPAGAWFWDVERSLRDDTHGWTSAIARIGQLSDEHAWALLSWIEVAAGHVVRSRSQDELVTTAFAMSLVLQSALDRRDCSIVCSLLRRASILAGLNYTSGVTDGCGRAGALGEEALTLLLAARAETPSTHLESGVGESFSFTRVAAGFDVEDLELWLEGDDR